MDKTQGLVIRLIDFSESSCIVTIFSREFGKFTGLAKGGRRLKGPFESALDLLNECRVVFLRKSSDVLNLLTEAKLERRFRPRVAGRAGLACLYGGYFVAELLADLTDEFDPHPELYAAAVQTLAGLRQPQPRTSDWLLWFEFAALHWLGHSPALEQCAGCGSAVTVERRVPFGLLAGGVLCPTCRTRERQVISLSAAAWQALCALAAAQQPLREPPPLAEAAAGELRGVLGRYLAHLLGHEPKLLPYVQHLG